MNTISNDDVVAKELTPSVAVNVIVNSPAFCGVIVYVLLSAPLWAIVA